MATFKKPEPANVVVGSFGLINDLKAQSHQKVAQRKFNCSLCEISSARSLVMQGLLTGSWRANG